MSEKPREDEKLSFKEQILRDLERVKKSEEDQEEVNLASIKPQFSSKNDQSIEELMEDSLSAVEEIMRKAPTVPTHPSQDAPVAHSHPSQDAPAVPSHPSQEVPASPVDESVPRPEPVIPRKVEKEFNEIPTRVAVSYKTEGQREIKREVPASKPVVEKKVVEGISETPRRSRRETVKPVKKKKSHLKAFFISLLIFLALISAGAYFGYQYVQSSLQPVDASSKQYVTVQIPEGANVQTIGSTLEKAGLVKHGIVFGMYTKYKN